MKHTFFLFLMVLNSCSGSRPTTLGLSSGKFSDCPKTPNCVNSFAEPSDDTHFIPPISIQDSSHNEFSNLSILLSTMDRVKIVTQNKNYLYAEFTSKLFRFVDDVEFYLDEKQKVIHVRSASRIGGGDLGVNRKRIEMIRELLLEKK